MRTILFTTSEIGTEFLEESLQDFILKGSPMKGPFMGSLKSDFMRRLQEKPKSEQIKILNLQKQLINKMIEQSTQRLKDIDQNISELESDT